MDLLTPDQLAEELGVALSTLANWRSQGRGPAYVKTGGLVRYERDTVNAWIASRMVATR